MFPERAGMCVRLITSDYLAVVRFVTCVHVRMLFPVGRVGETALASNMLTFERFFSWQNKTGSQQMKDTTDAGTRRTTAASAF